MYSDMTNKAIYTTSKLKVDIVGHRQNISFVNGTATFDLTNCVPSGKVLYDFVLATPEANGYVISATRKVGENKITLYSNKDGTIIVNVIAFCH